MVLGLSASDNLCRDDLWGGGVGRRGRNGKEREEGGGVGRRWRKGEVWEGEGGVVTITKQGYKSPI